MNQLKSDGSPSKFDRSSWITQAIAVLIRRYILYPALFSGHIAYGLVLAFRQKP